jgi:hypothetical protein
LTVARRFVFRAPSDTEYLELPVSVRRTFEEILPALVRQPFRSGAGFTVGSVRRHPGLWKLKLTDFPPRTFRAIYEVDGEVVRFLGFGPRPDFYRRLRQTDRISRDRF